MTQGGSGASATGPASPRSSSSSSCSSCSADSRTSHAYLTGLTFGTISALFGLTNHVMTQQQYTILVTTVIGSAIVPTVIAQRLFQPELPRVERTEEDAEVLTPGS